MFSWVMLRKVPPSIKRASATLRLCARFLGSQSQGFTSPKLPTSSSSSSLSSIEVSRQGGRTGKESSFDILEVSSGAWMVGFGLGLCYFCSLHNPNSQNRLFFADYPKDQAAAWATSEDQFVQPSDKKKSSFIIKDSYRRRVFFNYEKRIRLQSPPEKVFEYFASIKGQTGEIFMTPADLMRAVVPVFSPSESNRVREGFLRGETVPGKLYCVPSKFFMLFDTNNDGLISFPEYIFFITILSIPEESFSVAFKMFDLDNNGVIDREEFKKVMAVMRSQNRQAANHRGGRRLGLNTSVENGGLVEYFFGKDGNNCLQHEKFVEFLRSLQEELLHLEFSHYDYKMRGTILAKDFALSLVASAGINHINKLLDRVDELDNEPQLKEIEITYEEFKAFAELRKKLQSFSLAIFSYGKVTGSLTKSDFQRAASQVCGITLTDKVIDIIFHVFDANRDGNLSANELVTVLAKRESSTQARSPGFRGMIDCWLNCATGCSSTKLNI